MSTLLVAGMCAATFAATETELFNGRDLSGWTAVLDQDAMGGYSATEKTWAVVDGAIRTTGTPFGYLRTKRSDIKDFTLKLEYRWWRKTEKPNSGVFFRLTRETGSFIPECYENQLCRGLAGDLVSLAGKPVAGVAPRSPYDATKPLSGISIVPKAAKDAERAEGEWNTLEITVSGDTFISRLNGVEQNRVKGLAVQAGALALQSEGGAIEFKNIRLITF